MTGLNKWVTPMNEKPVTSAGLIQVALCISGKRGCLELLKQSPPGIPSPDISGFFVLRLWLSNLNLHQNPLGLEEGY